MGYVSNFYYREKLNIQIRFKQTKISCREGALLIKTKELTTRVSVV